MQPEVIKREVLRVPNFGQAKRVTFDPSECDEYVLVRPPELELSLREELGDEFDEAFLPPDRVIYLHSVAADRWFVAIWGPYLDESGEHAMSRDTDGTPKPLLRPYYHEVDPVSVARDFRVFRRSFPAALEPHRSPCEGHTITSDLVAREVEGLFALIGQHSTCPVDSSRNARKNSLFPAFDSNENGQSEAVEARSKASKQDASARNSKKASAAKTGGPTRKKGELDLLAAKAFNDCPNLTIIQLAKMFDCHPKTLSNRNKYPRLAAIRDSHKADRERYRDLGANRRGNRVQSRNSLG